MEKAAVANGDLRGKGRFFATAKKHWILLLMLLPATLYTILFSYVPMTGIVMAFQNYQYTGGIYFSPWVGMDNFNFLLIGGKLGMVTRNTLLYNIAFILLGIGLFNIFVVYNLSISL